MNYLIGYKDPEKNGGHEDPVLREFSYGHSKNLKNVSQGDILFFHTTIYNKRFITAYYYVQEVKLVNDAQKDDLIMKKFANHHLLKDSDELKAEERIVIGDPVRSRVLDIPLEVTEEMLLSLEKPAKLNDEQSSQAAMASSLRKWKKLGFKDVSYILNLIEEEEREGVLQNRLLQMEEVVQVLERDVEMYIYNHPEELEKGLRTLERQYIFEDGSRLDLLMEDEAGAYVVIEVKKGRIGRDAKRQIRHYMKMVQKEKGAQTVKGMIVCAGILPHFEEELFKAQKDGIYVKTFGWKMSFQ